MEDALVRNYVCGWWLRFARGFVHSGICADECDGSYATRVVVLGTGNPSADPERWGPAVAWW